MGGGGRGSCSFALMKCGEGQTPVGSRISIDLALVGPTPLPVTGKSRVLTSAYTGCLLVSLSSYPTSVASLTAHSMVSLLITSSCADARSYLHLASPHATTQFRGPKH